MKLTDYINGLGRVVAYYPNLKKVTGSTNATILLCQLLYWTDKSKDGWIWKTSDDIEEETGLTYYEQKTAKTALEDLGIIAFEHKRLDHMSKYKVDKDVLNNLWEASYHPTVSTLEMEMDAEAERKRLEREAEEKPKTELGRFTSARGTPTAVKQEGDMVDAYISAMESPGMKKARELKRIQDMTEEKLAINADGNKRWQKFIEYAHSREKLGEDISVFLDWAIEEGFTPKYWSPEKMITMWPQAFVLKERKQKQKEEFVKTDRVFKEKEYAPMPKDL